MRPHINQQVQVASPPLKRSAGGQHEVAGCFVAINTHAVAGKISHRSGIEHNNHEDNASLYHSGNSAGLLLHAQGRRNPNWPGGHGSGDGAL